MVVTMQVGFPLAIAQVCLIFLYQFQSTWKEVHLSLGKSAPFRAPVLPQLITPYFHPSPCPVVFLWPPLSLFLCLFLCLMAPRPWLSYFRVACWPQPTLGPVALGSWRAQPLRRSCPFIVTWWVLLQGLPPTVPSGNGFWLGNCDSTNFVTANGFQREELPNCFPTCFIHLRELNCVWLPHCVGGMEAM